jgi:hypothetical protein
MQVQAFDLDGNPTAPIELAKVDNGRLTVNGQSVGAVRIIGSRVQLILLNEQLCVTATDYVRVAHQGDAADGTPT